jgi:hypothetical protein
MKFISGYTLIALACFTLVGCGGGGSAATLPTATSAPPPAVVVENLNCKLDTNTVTNLSIEPVNEFHGLYSNWSNAGSVPGKYSSDRFSEAVNNAAVVAYVNNDSALLTSTVNGIYNWANKNAFMNSKMCWKPSLDSSCTQWVDPLGNDLSPIQDFNFITQIMEGIRRSYDLIEPWAKTNQPAKHQVIRQWLDSWTNYIVPPNNNAFFGLGVNRYHYTIEIIEERQGIPATVPLITELLNNLIPLINDDGSIKDRTTRGSRSLWYHYTALGEISSSMYLARRAGVPIPPLLEKRFHGAVTLFLNGVKDPATILPWAQVGFNNGNNGTVQDFDFAGWYNEIYGGSWIYTYPKWYPNHSNTALLNSMISFPSKSSYYDLQFGTPLGCLMTKSN